MRKTIAGAALTVAVVGGVFAGVLVSGPTAALAETAAAGTIAAAVADGAGPVQDALDELVANGTLTQDQADAVKEALQEVRADHRRLHRLRGIASDTVLDVLGIDADALREALRNGDSLADIATANGVDPQAVIDALVAEASERLDAAVENGRITAEDAAEKLGEIEERITDAVNGEGEFPFGRRHRHRGGFPGATSDADDGNA